MVQGIAPSVSVHSHTHRRFTHDNSSPQTQTNVRSMISSKKQHDSQEENTFFNFCCTYVEQYEQ